MDISIFEDLGLTSAEVKVYIAALGVGSSSVGLILEKSDLQNSVVHRALNSLIEKGLISYLFDGKKKIYSATDPECFYDFIDEKKKRFSEVLPELKEKQLRAKTKNNATVYYGLKGIKEVYYKLINSGGKEYNTYGGGKRVTFDVMGDNWWKAFHTKRIAKKIPSRQVFDTTIEEFGKKLSQRPITKIKFLPSDFEQLAETVIIGDLVAIVIFTETPYALLIKDPIVADSYRKNFEVLWKKAK